MTDEQRSRRPIFNAALWAAAGWLFFHVARSTAMIQIAALRSRLEKQPTRPAAEPKGFRRRCTSAPKTKPDFAPGNYLAGWTALTDLLKDFLASA